MARRTVVRITGRHGKVVEHRILWVDEDGPTGEEVRDVAISLINNHWLDVGDKLTVTEEGAS